MREIGRRHALSRPHLLALAAAVTSLLALGCSEALKSKPAGDDPRGAPDPGAPSAETDDPTPGETSNRDDDSTDDTDDTDDTDNSDDDDTDSGDDTNSDDGSDGDGIYDETGDIEPGSEEGTAIDDSYSRYELDWGSDEAGGSDEGSDETSETDDEEDECDDEEAKPGWFRHCLFTDEECNGKGYGHHRNHCDDD